MKTLNKVISVLIIMILLTADFSVLGTGLKSYAASNTDNIKYDVYFVNEKGEKATNNGNAKVLDNITNNEGIVEVEIANEENENKEVQWSKTGYDQIVVTLIYEEKVEVQEEAVTATSEITLYNDTKIEGNSEQVLKEEVNNVLVVQENSSVSQIYKGQLYANTVSNNKKEIEYKDQTTVFVTNANIVNQIKVTEKAEKFLRGEEEISASSRYVSTKINKAKMIDIK